jgi:hypothetical protein
MINIQYINKGTHEVVDSEVYFFKSDEIKLVPERLAEYLCTKYPNSFKKVDQTESKQIIEINQALGKLGKIVIYRKLYNEHKFKRLPPSQDVKFA